jgi:hypothetical protein
MVIPIFGSWVIAALLFYVAQNKSKEMKIILRILAFLFLTWPFLAGIWGNYIAPLFK